MGTTDSSEKVDLPPLYFINKQKSTAYLISTKHSSKIKFSKSVRISIDAAIGYIPEEQFKILICGGSDISNSFTNRALILNPSLGTTKAASDLPIASKQGFLLYYKEWVYYAGHTSFNDQCEDKQDPGQLMRYHSRKDYWEIIPDILDISEKETKVKGILKTQKTPRISDIYNPSVVIFKGVLYFIGGELKNSKGRLHSSSEIFSVNLKKKDFRLIKTTFRLTFKVTRPLCVTAEKGIILIGGTVNNIFSKSCLFLKFVEDDIEVTKLPELNTNFIDDHPHVFYKGTTIVFAFPNIYVLKDKANSWKQMNIFDIEKIKTKSSKQKKQEDEVEKKRKSAEFESKKSHKKKEDQSPDRRSAEKSRVSTNRSLKEDESNKKDQSPDRRNEEEVKRTKSIMMEKTPEKSKKKSLNFRFESSESDSSPDFTPDSDENEEHKVNALLSLRIKK